MVRLKAFTLLEVTVALLLTGILVTLAYGILGSFNDLAARSYRMDDELQRFRDLQLVLDADADRSRNLYLTRNGFAFTNRSGAGPNYERVDDCLIRHFETSADTFRSGHLSIHASLDGLEVTRDGEPFDLLDLAMSVAGDTMHVFCTMPYDAVTRNEMR